MRNCLFTPAYCQIDLDKIAQNFQILAKKNSLMPVIKADAYSHGLLEVASVLDKVSAKHFAVGTVSEGLFLRKFGFKQQILPLLGQLTIEDWQDAINANLTLFLTKHEDLQSLANFNRSQKLKIALKFDTGMSRLGFTENDLPAIIDFFKNHNQLQPFLALSHFAVADDPSEIEFTKQQRQKFAQIMTILRSEFPEIQASLENSAATLIENENSANLSNLSMSNLSRPGLALYGGDLVHNSDNVPAENRLQWAMSLIAPILQIRHLEAGQSVSYGRIFKAKQAMTIAIVACGYANGLARVLSQQFSPLLRGRACPQIGRICMSMLMLDVSSIPKVQIGELVYIMGGEASDQKSKPVTPLELAEKSQAIPYEILCSLGSMNPRKYKNLTV